MRREDLKTHEIRKRIVAKDCVNTAIIPMTFLREEACVFLEKTVVESYFITTHYDSRAGGP